MQIVELKVNVEKSQLAQLEAQVNKLDGKKIDLKVNIQGLQGINKEMTNFVNAMARYQGASAKIASANAKQRDSESKLAIAQEKTAQTANRKAEAHSKLLTQMQRTQTEERKLQTQIQKTNTERQRSVTQVGRVMQEEVKLQQQMERTRRAQEQNAKGAQAYGQAMEKAGKQVSGFQRLMGGSLGEIAGRMFMWQAMGELVSIPIQALKNAVGTLKEVDSELVNIQKVTGMNGAEMDALSDKAYKMASQYGRTATEVTQAMTAFARAGYGEKLEEMAEMSTLLQNIGDVAPETANSMLLAVDAAWGLGGSQKELMAVMDGMNEVTNRNATDMQKLADGVTVAASIFAESGESIQDFVALVGTGTAVTQRSGPEIARGLRTIMMNIRQIRGETEDGELIDGESIAKASLALKEFAGISTMTTDGELRKATEVLDELAEKWDTLDSVAQSAIAEALAGKRQANILTAIMSNWEIVEKQMTEYANGAGSALRENEIYMDSWEAKSKQLSASWTEFVNNLVNTGTIKTGLDGITAFFSALNDGMEAAKKDGDFWDNLWDIANFNSIDKVKGKVSELEKEYEALTGAGSEYAQLLERSQTGELTLQEERRLAVLKSQAQVIEQQLKFQREQAYQLFQATHGTDTNKRTDRKTGETVTVEGTISKDVEATQKLTKAQDELFEKFKRGGSNIQEYRDGIAKLIVDNEELYKNLSQFDEWGFDLSDAQREFLDFYNWMLDTVNLSDEELKVEIAFEGFEQAKIGMAEFANQTVVDGARLKKALEEAGVGAETIATYIQGLKDDGVIVIDVEADGAEVTLEQLEALGVAVDTENGKEINIEGLDQLATELGMNRTKAVELVTALGLIDGVTFVNAKGEIVSVEQAIDSLKTKSAVDVLIDAKDQATDKLKDVQKLAEIVGKLKKTVTINANDNASGPIAKIQNALRSLRDRTINVRTNNITTNTIVSTPGNSSGNTGGVGVRGRYTKEAEGTRNYKGGPALLGDELSPDGSPRPELVIRRSGDAFLAGVNGPVAMTLPAGSRIFNYRETMDILSGRDTVELPAYANAAGGGGGGAKSTSLLQRAKNGIAKVNATASTAAASSSTSGSSTAKTSSGSSKKTSSSSAKKTSGGKSSSTGGKSSSSSGKSSSGSSSSSSSSTANDEDEYLESLKKQLEVLQAQYSFLEASDAETGELIAKSQEIQGQLHTINDYLRATGGEEKEILDNSASWYKELEKIRESQRSAFQKERALLESEVELYEKQGQEADAIVGKLKAIQDTLQKEADYLRSIKAEQAEINELSIEWWEIQEKIQATQRAIFQDERALLNTEVELYERQGKSVAERISKLREVQTNLKKEIQYLETIKASQTEINELTLEWWDVQDKILQIRQDLINELNNAVSKEIQKAQEQRDAELAAIDAQIQRLKEERDIQKEQLELEEKRKKIEEARFALENAQHERTVRYYNKQTNQWEWGPDQASLKSAQKSYEDAQKDLEEYLAEKAFEAQIKALEDQKEEINGRYDQIESGWKNLLEQFEEPVRDIVDILNDLKEAELMAVEKVDEIGNYVGDIKEYTGQINQSITGTRTSTVARSADGSEYQIGSQRGIDFVNSAAAGTTMTGGDGSSWTKNANGTTTITKNGKTYTTSGASSYEIGSEKGINFVNSAASGETMTGGDGSQWRKNADGSTTITKNGTTYTVNGTGGTSSGISAGSSGGSRTGYSSSGAAYNIGSQKGLDFINNSAAGATMIGGDGSTWTKLANGSTTITKNGVTYTVYDSGGILSGIGGIKRSGGDEMVIPPDITNFMLRPAADQRFRARMAELSYLYGNRPLPGTSSKNRTSQDHYGDVYTFGDVTLSEDKAKSTTVYELAQMSRSLGLHRIDTPHG